LLNKIGVTDAGLPGVIFATTAGIQSSTALASYFIFKGYRAKRTEEITRDVSSHTLEKLTSKQIITLTSVIVLFIAVIFFRVPVGIGAFIISSVLFLFKTAEQKSVLKSLPWSIILLVTGITLLIGLVERTGGMDVATSFIADHTSPKYLYSILSLVSGVVSIYSSSSGVVMPTFISLLPGLLQKLGTGDLVKMAIAVDIGSHMVDVSPLSTLGALCLASAAEMVDKTKLFRNLLIWGFSMAIAGAVLCYLFLDVGIFR